jgi:hypothetical protein
MIRRTGVAFHPWFSLATVLAVDGLAARAAREFLVAVVTIAAAGAGALRAFAILAKSLAARRIGALLAAFASWRIGPLVAEFLVGEATRRPRVAALATRCIRSFFTAFTRRVRTLLAATFARAKIFPWPVIRTVSAARGAIVPVETRRPRRVAIVAARRRTFALAGVGLARTRIRLFAVGFRSVGLSGIRTILAIALARIGAALAIAFAGKAALGEFLLRPPCRTGAALAARGSIPPAARRGVVFIVIAGHEWSHCGYMKWRSG